MFWNFVKLDDISMMMVVVALLPFSAVVFHKFQDEHVVFENFVSQLLFDNDDNTEI